MKTTVDLPDELLIAAKKRAAENRTTLGALFERGLRRELAEPEALRRAGRLRCLTVNGGLPPDVDIGDRERMHEWMRSETRDRRGR